MLVHYKRHFSVNLYSLLVTCRFRYFSGRNI